MRPLYSDELRRYLDNLVPGRPPELVAMEAYATEHDFPIIGPASGQCCYALSRMIGATRVFELGSGYGYSTAWFARAVRENGGGTVHHTVWDDALSGRARGHLAALGYGDLVTFHVGEAVAMLRASRGPYDVVFLDIDKPGYPPALPVIAEKLRRGGLLIVDNMLYSGRVYDPKETGAATVAVREATGILTSSPEWVPMMIPVRDGLMVAMRA